MPRLNEFDHAKVVILRQLGWSYRKIAEELQCSKRTSVIFRDRENC